MPTPIKLVLLGLLLVVVSQCGRGTLGTRGANAMSDTVLITQISDSLVKRENWAYSPENVSSPFVRSLVVVQFNAAASSAQRRAALDSVRGIIFAKSALGAGEPLYYVRLTEGGADSAVFSAIRVLKRQSAIKRATLELIERIP